MTTYKLKSIEYKDNGFEVQFIPNDEPIVVTIPNDQSDRFFDALKQNDFRTNNFRIRTRLKNKDSDDAMSFSNTVWSDWIKCRFNSGIEHEELHDNSCEPIKMGEYDSEPLYWSKIGEVNDYDLYLCDSIVEKIHFDERTNDWNTSDIRRFCMKFYDDAFSVKEAKNIVSHPETNDRVFLLSIAEFELFKDRIKKIEKDWWLRSPGYDTYIAALVYKSGAVNYYNYYVDNVFGVRPALFLKS